MELTEEQRERIRRNRERALEIQRRKKREREAAEQKERERKRSKKVLSDDGGKQEEEEQVELEEFEMGASEFVTKTEAMKVYCLPDGTLAVCKYVEKENPKNKGWTPMKLYFRAEIRRRARERHGGIEGLVAERRKRAEKRYQKDLEETKDLFR